MQSNILLQWKCNIFVFLSSKVKLHVILYMIKLLAWIDIFHYRVHFYLLRWSHPSDSGPPHWFSKWGGQNCPIFSISRRCLHCGRRRGKFRVWFSLTQGNAFPDVFQRILFSCHNYFFVQQKGWRTMAHSAPSRLHSELSLTTQKTFPIWAVEIKGDLVF